ncbi:hypothetical protein C3L33_13237, partial [Rhododendron williamsianum]
MIFAMASPTITTTENLLHQNPSTQLTRPMTDLGCGDRCSGLDGVMPETGYQEKMMIVIVIFPSPWAELSERVLNLSGDSRLRFLILFVGRRKNLRPEIPRCCPISIANVMIQCWDANPDKRPNMDKKARRRAAVPAPLAPPLPDDAPAPAEPSHLTPEHFEQLRTEISGILIEERAKSLQTHLSEIRSELRVIRTMQDAHLKSVDDYRERFTRDMSQFMSLLQQLSDLPAPAPRTPDQQLRDLPAPRTPDL